MKALSPFFIDEKAKFRHYGEEGELPGEYAEIIEQPRIGNFTISLGASKPPPLKKGD